ncbi:FACT complex subunit SPT16-like isoform X1 [Sycon ciliatum]|uniref:FACT complex subunit SPT16-like isoform X1 n=1 Tax=Sycon ciliatum TaxID=27933 RepID=UPI0031F5F239
MGSPSINVEQFQRRLKVLLDAWKNDTFACDALCALVGSSEDIMYSKSTALQTWLLGYELTDTLIVIGPKFFTVIASKKKLSFMQPLEKLDSVKVSLVLRSKEDNSGSFADIFSQVKDSKNGKRLGILAKDKFGGDFVPEWQKAISGSGLETVDESAHLAYIIAPKDSAELQTMKKSSQLSSDVFSKFFKAEVLKIVDREKRVKHSVLANSIEKTLHQNKQLLGNADPSEVEVCYSPIVQSGGDYSLKFSLVSNDKNLKYDTIICQMGARYRSYCSNIVRTMMVQPSETQQEDYKILLETEEVLQKELKAGVKLCDVYSKTYDFLSSKKKSLAEHATKTFGFATGIEFKEASLTIGPKCQAVVKAGMVFNLAIGMTDLSSSDDDENYALFIGDTVLTKEKEPAELLTASKKQVKNVAIFMETEKAETNGAAKEDLQLVVDGNTVLENRTRQDMTAEEKRKSKQRELGDQLNETARRRLLDKDDPSSGNKSSKSAAVAYRHASLLPKDADVQELRIFVDTKHEAIIVPVGGQSAVFHISMLKNCSKTEHGDFSYLRLNFFCPGNTVGRAEGAAFPDPSATFVKELVFKASNTRNASQAIPSTNLATAFRLIKEAQKRFKTREAERKEMEGVIAQADLVISQNRNVPRLKDLFVRPSLTGGQHRTQGVLHAHVNGFRYQPYKGGNIDILYNNIKHAIFQPSKGEMIVLLHFHLKHAILIQKKKYLDIQFFTEVGEVVTDLGRRQNMHDRDDLEAEQAERDLRHRVEMAFKGFMDKVQQFSNLEVDTTFRDLGFHGVPHKSSVLLQPTTYCLVHLVESPVTMITLSEVELVHFERVSFQMKNFDAVFIFKDYKRKVFLINAIPMTSLDSIKEWLTTSDIKYTEGIQSLNWAKIMKTISDDPAGFFEGGGWSFLDPDESDQGGDDSEEETDYQPSGSDEPSDESSDEDYSDEASESDEEEELDSDESSGKDWSDLEEEAIADDNETNFDDDVEERPRKRKSSGAPPVSAAKRRR